jgi:flagellar basal-body rod protein FlgF
LLNEMRKLARPAGLEEQMADGIYVSMAGATARERQLESIADDLANAQTPGFKSSRPVFKTVLAEQNGLRAFPAAAGAGTDLRAGATVSTGNPLDVLPDDGNFLAVRSASGQVGYTRDGRLSLDAQGTLRAAGLPVLTSDGRTVSVAPTQKLALGQRGQIVIDGTEVGRLGQVKLEGLTTKSGPSVLVPAQGGRATQVTAGLQTGVVEQGNRTALDSMVDLISAQRSFDASMQAIDAYRKMGDRSSELGKVR